MSGLSAGYELKRAGYDVRILEASSRVGGRVKTFRKPTFAPGLHGEGGAMRIPKSHFLLLRYIKYFGLQEQLFPFEMENRFIYVSGYGQTLTYKKFSELLEEAAEPDKQSEDSKKLLALFPGLKDDEKGLTCDNLFMKAVRPVNEAFKEALGPNKHPTPDDIKRAYQAITDQYDKYTLRSYLTEVAGWSQDAINLYDLGNAHVVFENGFIESFKDAFLSSNDQGAQAQMRQLQNGMSTVPEAFISPDRGRRTYPIDTFYSNRSLHSQIL